MKLTINIKKKHFFGLLALGLIVLGVVGVIASNPSVFGHSTGEINWEGSIPKLCLGGTCITSWAGLGGGAAITEDLTVGGVKIVSVNGSNAACPNGFAILASKSASVTCGVSGSCQATSMGVSVGGSVSTSCTVGVGGWTGGSSPSSCTYYVTQTNPGSNWVPSSTSCLSRLCYSNTTEVLCVGSA